MMGPKVATIAKTAASQRIKNKMRIFLVAQNTLLDHQEINPDDLIAMSSESHKLLARAKVRLLETQS